MKSPTLYLNEIETVWIDPTVRNHPLAQRISTQFPASKIRIGFPEGLLTQPHPLQLDRIKKRLFLTHGRGHLVKPCPGSRGRICCGYWVINAMLHCPMDCHYCILQSYLSVPALTVFVDEDTIREEIQHRLGSRDGHIFRFGTGELGDSLIHDALTGFSRRMVPFFANTRNGILELKTKTALIGSLKGLDPKGHTVASWSINPQSIIQKVEPKTASLSQRIKAARQCQDMGYWIGLHFDPVIWFEGWEKAYHEVIESLAQSLDPRRIIWISLAGLRYTRQQKETIKWRFGDTLLFFGEFFRDEDGKFRYLQSLRISMYQKLIKWLMEWSPDLFIYFCMENRRVWEETFPSPPHNTRELDERFNQNVWRFLKRG